jgi:hypothetical protein
MAKLFGRIARLPRIKICVSSRPHVVFEKAFATWPSLRLQDLTYNDVRNYVEDRLVKDESVQELFAREPVETAKVVKEIIDAADGVFLWVYLAVSSLLQGVGNCDDIQDLQRKLRLLPRDLKQLYIHIMLKIDDDYKEEALQFFQLFQATERRDDEDKDLKPMAIFGLYLAKEQEAALPEIIKSLLVSPYQTTLPPCIAMSRRLKSRTGGFLKVQFRSFKLTQISPHMKVGYLHRTVRDFLVTKEMRSIIQADMEFDADYAMLKSSVYNAQVEGLHSSSPDIDLLYDCALTYARRCQERRQSQSLLLDQLYTKVFLRRARDRQPKESVKDFLSTSDQLTTKDSDGSEPFELFLRSAIAFNLHRYLTDKLKVNEDVPASSTRRRLLSFALTLEATRHETILSLLAFGAEPFLPDGEPRESQKRMEKPWSSERLEVFQKAVQHLEHSYYSAPSRTLDSQLEIWAEVLKLLLVRKASVSKKRNEQLTINSKYLEASKVISRIFYRHPDLNAQLQALMTEKSKTSCRTQ